MPLTEKPVGELTYGQALGNLREGTRLFPSEYEAELLAHPEPVLGEDPQTAKHRELAARIRELEAAAATSGVVLSRDPNCIAHHPV